MEKKIDYQSLKKKFLYLGSAAAFVAALVLYLVCVDPGASLWDCPEYITGARRLEVGHPPGNPTWLLTANFVSAFVSEPTHVALAINLLSCFATALAVALLFQTIFFLLEAAVFKSRTVRALASTALASLCGSLVFAWCDSTIFSAVEAEVYSLSLLSTAFMVWFMLKWAIAYREGENRKRYLILLGYVAGLSFGIHELSLLTFTTLFLIYVFALNKESRPLATWTAVVTSFCVIAFILLFWIPGIVSMTGKAELLGANSLGFPSNIGALVFLSVLFIVLLCLPFLVHSLKLPRLATACWIFFFFTAGCSTYLLIPVRAAANPPMNQANPSNPFTFYSYLTREQYGSKPLFYGKTPYSSPLSVEEIDSSGHASYSKIYREKKTPKYARYVKNSGIVDRYGFLTAKDSLENQHIQSLGEGYVKYGYSYDYVYEPELNVWFPRITASSPTALSNYKAWAGMDEETMDYVPVSGAIDSLGNFVGRYPLGDASRKREKAEKYRPTYLQQLRYLLTYQVGYMYLRYLMWNFSGRQNNIPSTGEIDHGNFITGFPAVDSLMLGDQTMMPAEIGRDNPGYNRYFMLPLLFGIFGAIGITYFGRNGRRASAIVLSLFLMTGIAIVFYLNQDPVEPRERDYSFIGSFYAFCIWIGFGAAICLNWAFRIAEKISLKRHRLARTLIPGAAVLVCLGLPVLMLSQTYDDHNRSGRDSAAEIAVNFLNSLDRDAIVIVEGDNKYFPLVYAQEVLGVRRDVSVVLQSYFFSAWYIAQLQRPGEESHAVAMMMPRERLLYEAYPFVRVGPEGTSAPAAKALKSLYEDESASDFPTLEAETLIFDSRNGPVSVNLRTINEGKSLLGRDKLALIDILATNGLQSSPRPVYWQADIHAPVYKALEKYSVPSLYARKWIGNVTELDFEKADKDETSRFLKMLGNKNRERLFYAEPYVASNLSFLRKAAIELADRLAEEGKVREGAEVLQTALSYWPYSLIPPQRMSVEGKRVEELDVVVSLLEKIRNKLPIDTDVERSYKELSEMRDKRREEYLEYYNSLPAWRRNAVSVETLGAAGIR